MNTLIKKSASYLLNAATLLLIGTVLILPSFFTPVTERVIVRDMLTFDETMSMIIMEHQRVLHIYPRANPAALEELIELSDSPEMKRLIDLSPNTIRLMGYIGDESHLERLRLMLDEFDGHIPLEKRRLLNTVFDSLAVMSRRGIPGAEELMKECCDYRTWEKRLIQMENDEYPEQSPETIIYGRPTSAINSYGIYGGGDWRKLRDELLESVEDETWRGRILNALRDERMEREALYYNNRMSRPFTEMDRRNMEMAGLRR